ncbi:LADA_0B07536g1_1 [Lachancea dasiensis]|uniref:LADA_0B07536g1_1 n=1 Tax=Lachancea dasiensis TaxID=1072105 RepID=A0A1G4IU41_9SACH|nr:LADA_0B07536g1_1 [Lachancea dasiensis]
MRTYGRHGRFRSLIASQELSSESFSDEERNWDTFTSDEPFEALTPKSSLGGEPNPKVMHCAEKSAHGKTATRLEVLDFLDEQPLKRRKKTLQHSTRVDPDNTSDCDSSTISSSQAERSFQSTIQDANKMISTIGEAVNRGNPDWQLAGSALSENPTASGSSSTRITYGKNRTMVFNEDDEGVASYSSDEDHNSREFSQSTQHFNQLKSTGETLGYQDELEFMLQRDATMTAPAKRSRLLDVALAFLKSPEMLEYAIKHHQTEVCESVLDLCSFENYTFVHVGGFVLSQLRLQPDNSLWNSIGLRNLLLQLVHPESDYTDRAVTEVLLSRYNEFLQLVGSTSGLLYGLKLWNVSLDHHDVVDSRECDIAIRLLEENCSYPHDLFKVAEKILCKSSSQAVPLSRWFEALVSWFPAHITDDGLVKALVKATNDNTQLQGRGAEKVFEASLSFLLEYLHSAQNLEDVVVLHLGLCLNVIQIQGVLQVALGEKMLDRLYCMLKDLHKLSDKGCAYKFKHNMYLLICCYISLHQSLSFQLAERKFVETQLKAFASEVKLYNTSIYASICTVLESIAV